MNPNNYVTLEQAKKMKELGYPQDNTDARWAYVSIGAKLTWILVSKDICSNSGQFLLWEKMELDGDGIANWYAAPNAQEIDLDLTKFGGGDLVIIEHVPNSHTPKTIEFGLSHHAQARADAWIWEREK